MTLNEYQEKAMDTCLPSCENFSYMMLNLVGEVGELAGKAAKAIRKEEVEMYNNNLHAKVYGAPKFLFIDHDLKSEAGDILWQLSGLCEVMGWSLEDVAQGNLDKLAARKAEGTIITHADH
ncbi:MAG: nucleoside triphosphate pyrophosphohydrolase family protein [Alistipes sp.]|nr:nucleoside triphosphate pyrophosphohydrolase family protein [Alistipes sp.]